MSTTMVGILGFICIAVIVVVLFQSRTQPSIAFIAFPAILEARDGTILDVVRKIKPYDPEK